MKLKEIEISSLYATKNKSLNPIKFPNETFSLLSIKAFDNGSPEIIKGKDIGSSKKILQHNDVILSRIVPHIQRCWIVNENKEYRSIGSGEWIIFRNDSFIPKYLKYLLISKPFHSMFMGTVKGVGGSLLRADPKQVGRFKVLLPNKEKQIQISNLIESADLLVQKSKKIIEEYDLLAKSLFIDMFGDNNFNQVSLEKLTTKITDGAHHTPKYKDSGVPFLRVTDITKSNDSKKFIGIEEHKELIKRCHPEKGDILYTKNGTIGVAQIVDWDYDFSIFVSLCLLKIKKDLVRPKFVEAFLNTDLALKQAKRHSKTGTITNLHLIEIKKIKCPLPSMDLQIEFEKRILLIENQLYKSKNELKESENLYNSLLQKAFKGELN